MNYALDSDGVTVTVLSPIISPAHAAVPVSAAPAEGVIKQRSDYGFDETIVRVKADIASKGIRFFDEIDQTQLGASASLPINRSTVRLLTTAWCRVSWARNARQAQL